MSEIERCDFGVICFFFIFCEGYFFYKEQFIINGSVI